MSHFKHLAPNYDTKRVCIKIPSTWEGMQACRELEKRGIATLATAMFCMEQAALAGEVGCTYIAPYVNELKVHFDKKYVLFCSGIRGLAILGFSAGQKPEMLTRLLIVMWT